MATLPKPRTSAAAPAAAPVAAAPALGGAAAAAAISSSARSSATSLTAPAAPLAIHVSPSALSALAPADFTRPATRTLDVSAVLPAGAKRSVLVSGTDALVAASPLHLHASQAAVDVKGGDSARLALRSIGATQGLHGGILHGVASKEAISKQQVRLEKPATVPAPPYFLMPHVVPVDCALTELRTHLDGALRHSNVDYEYNEAKWKAKCYIYKKSGSAMFVVRLYTEVGATGRETYLVEMQRRKGCHNIFRATYDAVLSNLHARGVIPSEHPAAVRARELRVPPASGAPQRGVGNFPPPPPSIADMAASFDGLARLSSSDEDAEQPTSSADAAAIAEAFIPLAHMLASEYDDISTPAAQSIASLCSSKRVCAVVGMKAFTAWRQVTDPVSTPSATPRATAAASTTTVGSMPGPPPAMAATRQSSVSSTVSARAVSPVAAGKEGTAILEMLRTLLLRAADVTLSVEGRTACILALQSLIMHDKACADLISGYHTATVLLDLAANIKPAASVAALRRECVHTVLALVSTDARRIDFAIRLGLAPRAKVLATGASYVGVDPAFDRWAQQLAALPAVAHAAAGTSIPAHAPSTTVK